MEEIKNTTPINIRLIQSSSIKNTKDTPVEHKNSNSTNEVLDIKKKDKEK